MTDQNQAPEWIWMCRSCGEVDICECPYNRQSYAPTDLLEAADRRIKELEELFATDGEQHANHVKSLTKAHTRRIEKYSEALRDAEAERDQLAAQYTTACGIIEKTAAERDQALASVGAVIEKAAELAAAGFHPRDILALNPDATAALNEKRALSMTKTAEAITRTADSMTRRALKAEAERDQALASMGAVIEKAANAALHPLNEQVGEAALCRSRILRLNPDATAALNEMLAGAWDEGVHADGWEDENPYRKKGVGK